MKRIREPIPSELKVKLSTEQEWKDVLQILEDDGWTWYTTHKPTELLSKYSKGDRKGICTGKRKNIGIWNGDRDYISAQSFIDTYSEKLLYEVGDVVVVTRNMGGDPVGVVTEVLRVQEDGNVWIKAITRNMATGWFHLPDSIRPATEEEIKVYKQSQKPVEDKIVVGDYIIGKDAYVPDVVCKVYEIEGNYYKYTYPSGREDKCQLRYIRKARQEEIDKYYPPKPVDEPWSIVTEDGVTVYEGDDVWWLEKDGKEHHTNTKISKSYEGSIKAGYKPFSTYKAAEEYRKKNTQPEQVTSTVKESIPVERKWKVGSQFTFRDELYKILRQDKDDKIWILKSDGNEISTTPDIIDYNWANRWIPYNPEPWTLSIPVTETPIGNNSWSGSNVTTVTDQQPVTVENAYIGMKVVRSKDWTWGNDGNTTPETVGSITSIEKGGTVKVMWPTCTSEKMYYIGGHYGRYDLYVAPENTVTITDQQPVIVVGDIVEIKDLAPTVDGKIGTVIAVDSTDMPYEVKIPNGLAFWLTKEQVKKVTKTNQKSQTKIKENEKHNQTSSTNNQQCISKQQDNEEVITYIRANSTVIEGPRISTGEAVTAMYKIKPQVIEK